MSLATTLPDPPAGSLVEVDLMRLARICFVAEYRVAPLPALYSIERIVALVSEGTLAACDALEVALGEAIEEIEDRRYGRAATAIFAHHESRWVSVGQRKAMAATAFGVLPDTYRHRRNGHPSRYDQTVSELARSLERLGPAPAIWPSALQDMAAVEVLAMVAEPVPTSVEKCRVAVRFTTSAYNEVQAVAARRDLTLDEYLRRALLHEGQPGRVQAGRPPGGVVVPIRAPGPTGVSARHDDER